jgi:NADH-quinone oxidoreductase subunit J
MTLLAALNWHSTSFLFFALLACGFAVAVVMTANIVRMAFYLTLSLGATAGLFFIAGAEFIGSMQLLIYVGGTLVLLIFGVMLTAQARFISMKTSGAEWVMAAILGSALFLLLLRAGYSVESWNQPRVDLASLTVADGKTSTPIGLALTGVRVDKLDEPNETLRRGMSGYLFPFVIISMHLLVVLIGASYMARTKRLSLQVVRERVAPTAPRVRHHSRAVMGGIVSGTIANIILAVLCFAYWLQPAGLMSRLTAIEPFLAPAAKWLWPLLGALFLVSALMLEVINGWQKWGVIALVLATIGQAVAIGNSGLDPRIAIGFFVLAIAPVALLIVLHCTGRRPTEWEQMD